MKKVMLLTAVFVLVASAAFAGVAGSKHDLSSSTGNTISSTNYDEICVFCHTPHGGSQVGFAPLWNRTLSAAGYAASDLYNSATLEAASKPSQVVDAVNDSDAKLCMSCHDGVSLGNALLNPANSAGNAQPAGLTEITGDANIGSDLTNDHPIGMDYDAVQGTDGELVGSAGTTPNYVGDAKVLLYDYSGSDVMWCSTCHDVHNDSNAPFLNISNAASNLCLNCHVK